MFELDENGVLVKDGEPVKIENQPVKLDGYLSKEKVSTVVSERLAREKAAVADQIKALEAQANRTPELEKMTTDLRDKLGELEKQASTAKQTAEKEVATRLERAEKRAQEYEQQLIQERQARVQDQVSAQILGATKDRWIDPAQDLVPKLLQTHKRETVKGKDGEPDSYEDLFEVEHKDEKGNTVREFLPLKDAVSVLEGREEFQHYLRATGREGGGAPGSRSFANSNQKRSGMTAQDKAQFVSKHGLEAYQSLPE